MTRSRLVLTMLVGALAASACGPTLTIHAGLQPAGANVFFGEPFAPSPLPAPAGANPLPEFPAPLEPAPQPLPPPVAGPACAVAPPTASPLQAAPTTPAAGPTFPGRYTYRVQGSQTQDGRQTALPATETRLVSQAHKITDAGTGNVHWQFAVAEILGSQTTTMVYDMEPNGPTGSVSGNTGTGAGLYLLQIKDSSGDSFTPASGIQLMPYPAAIGVSYPSSGWAAGSGVDPIHDEAMQIQSGSILGETRVDACGTVLDSWQVEIKGTIGSARGSAAQKTFDLTFDDGTLYGGIVLADHLVESGVDPSSGKAFSYDIAATIDSEPNLLQ